MENFAEYYQKYCETQKEDYFAKFYNNISGIIKHKIYIYGFYKKEDIEDIMQEVYIELFKSTENYKKDIGSTKAYINKIIFYAIISYINRLNSEKNKVNNKAISLEKYDSDDDKRSLEEVLTDSMDIENLYITRETIKEYIERICRRLSDMEKEIFKLDIISRDK